MEIKSKKISFENRMEKYFVLNLPQFRDLSENTQFHN
tara:strand:+ start:916 stop:1026 length:111 start_codon:yes stop_codon:yes gene_type:complete